MRNQHLAHALRAGLLFALVAFTACTVPPPDKTAAAAQPDVAQGVDAEFGVETFALSAPTLTVTAPANYEQIGTPGTSASVDFKFTTANFTPGKVLCFLDGVEVGSTATNAFTFPVVPKGLHNLACVLATDSAVLLTNVEARGTVLVKINPPCSTVADCQDDNACSQDTCAFGQCSYGAIANCCGSKFDCAVGETCNNPNSATSQCTTCAKDADCNDSDTCTTDTCDLTGAKGVCKNVKANPECCSKTTDLCSDFISCTSDSCNLTTGLCVHTKGAGVCCSDSECPSSDPCKVGSCVDNECRFGVDIFKPNCCSATTNTLCDDKNYCTDDACSTQPTSAGYKQCTHTPKKDPNDPTKPLKECCDITGYTGAEGEKIGTEQCDDQQPCTQDICQNYSCIHKQVADCCIDGTGCNDNNLCTTDACDKNPLNAPTGQCSHGKVLGCCQQAPDCDDNKYCTIDSCNIAAYTCKYTKIDPTCCDDATDCNDGSTCSVKACVNHACVFGPDANKPNCCDKNSNCNDGNACTVDVCDTANHLCVFTSNGDATCCSGSLACDDNDCTTLDFCDGTNHCQHKAAPEHCKDDKGCDDGLACTTDTCSIVAGCGTCNHVAAAVGSGCCTSDLDCDDSLGATPAANAACTADKCVNSLCQHTAITSCCIDDKDALTACDDKSSCTVDYCVNNQCRHTIPKNGCCVTATDCNDGDTCTTDKCNITSGQLTGTCSYSLVALCSCTAAGVAAGTMCNDGNACTTDSCTTNGLCAHAAITGCCVDKFDCNDGKPCTSDLCIQGECLHYDSVGGVSLCCNPLTEDVDCADKASECTTGKCLTQADGTYACQAVAKPVCTVNLSYCQDFSASSTLGAMGWNPIDVKGTAATNWGVATNTGLGPDQHARLTWTPTKTNYETCLASPIFQAAGTTTLSIQYDREYLPNGAGGNTALHIRGSTDGANTNWANATSFAAEYGSTQLGPDSAVVQIPAELVGSNGLRVAFCVQGASTFDLSSYAIDNVCVVKGSAPTISKCPVNKAVVLGTQLFVPIKATDPDPNDILSFSLLKGPSFVKLSSALYYWLDSSWNTTLVVTPLNTSDVGEYEVSVKVSDGYLFSVCTFKLTVTYQGGVLVWKPTEVPDSQGEALRAAITKQGKVAQVVDDLTLYPDLTKFDAVFIALGVYPDNHVLVDSEVGAIKLFLSSGGKVYMEGGDTWVFDTPTTLHPFFKIKGLLDSSPNGVTGPLKGYTNVYVDSSTSPAKALNWAFNQDFSVDNLNDQITANTTVLKTKDLLKNDNVEKFTVQVGHDDVVGAFRTIGSSIPFAGIQTGPDTADTMMKQVFYFFANGFVDCKTNADCDDGDACTADLCTAGVCSNDNSCLCAASTTLSCGQTITKNVTNSGDSTQATSTYSCDAGVYLGKEHAYKYTTTASKPVTVTLTNVTNPNARLFVLHATTKGCDPTGCVAAATVSAGVHTATFAAGKGETYYLVVDVPGATESAQYDMTVTCGNGEDCANGIDDNGNNLADCQDTVSCCGDAACQSEVCDGVDNNCNGTVDEGCDKDGDGYCDAAITTLGKPPICPNGGGDCLDLDGTVNPGATEICNNGKDDNCSGVQDEVDASGCTSYYTDLDADQYGTGTAKCLCAASGTFKATKAGDCNDSNLNVNPGLKETCDTTFDDNCDGSTNDVNAVNCVNFYTDTDADGYGTAPFKCMCVASGVIKVTKPGDCADANSAVNPGATEICNNLDDDCNGQTDEGCDDDKDGYCDANMTFVSPPTPAICPQGAGDSDDTDPKINPAGQEICDGKDNDSNGKIDEGCDDDKDGYCDSDIFTVGKPPICPGGGGDCNDTEAKVNPGVNEECSTAVDDNCNGTTNDLGATGCTPYFFDGDSDKWGTTASKCFCVSVGQYSAINPGDCNDDNSSINPAVAEICDGIDNNCDGTTDENCDADGDGYCAVGKVLVGIPAICPSGSGDCDDTDPAVNPAKAEVCGNGKDDNCSGTQNDLNAIGCTQFFADTDGDTYGVSTNKKCYCVAVAPYSATTGGDCNDGDKTINPGVIEACNGIDDNCNSQTDEICDKDGDGVCDAKLKVVVPAPAICPKGGGDCDDNDSGTYKGKTAESCDNKDDDCNGVTDNGCDDDKDGYCDAALSVSTPLPSICPKGSADCDDTDNTVFPGGIEICNNGKDDNCNGSVNDQNALGCSNFFFDGDADAFGLNLSKCLCSASGSFSASAGGDCDDTNATVKPGVTEVCDGKDNNCNAQVDEQDASGCATYFYDQDKDGYGVNLSQCLCAPTAPYSAPIKGDCNDTNPKSNPGATEVCDDADNNCDTKVDEGCNKDGDKFCDKSLTVVGTPLVCVLGGGDCVDTDAAISPIGNEVCDGKDNNCNGATDEGCDKDGDGYCDSNMTTVGTPGSCVKGGGDCNDNDNSINPGKLELCGNTVDENCNGSANDPGAVGCKQYYPDYDGDTYGKGGTSFQAVVINEFRRNTNGLSGLTGNEYIELLITADLAMTDVATLYFGDSSAAGDVKFAAYQLNIGALNITTLKAGTIITIGGSGIVTQDTTYDPSVGNWDLTFLTDGVYVKSINTPNAGDFAAGDVAWVATSPTGTGTIDSISYGGANSGLLGSAAKLALTGVPSNGGTGGTVVFIGDITSLDKNGSYQLDVAGTPGLANGGANTTFVNFLRAVSTGGDTKCLCAPDATYKTTVGGDCNDNNNVVYSGATELCDGVDNNCNGVVDEGCDKDGDGYCDATKITVGNPSSCPSGGNDCDDNNKFVNPGATEICGNSVDENCDGALTGSGASGCVTYYYDADGDGFGVNVSQCLCGPGNNFTATKIGDCDDTKATVNPASAEICGNGLDDNCNGTQNDVGATGCTPFFTDADKDGFGVGASSCLCQAEGAFIAPTGGDCLDTDNKVNPGAAEICDGKDNNCVGSLAADAGNAASGTSNSLTNYLAQDWVAIGSGNLTSVTVSIAAGSTGQGASCDVWTALPGTSGATKLDTVSVTLTSTSMTKYTFTFPVAPTVAAGTKYFFVWKASGSGTTIQESAGNAYANGLAQISATLTGTYSPLGGGATDVTFSTVVGAGAAGIDENCDKDGDKYCDANIVTIGKPAVCINGGGDCNDSTATVNPAGSESCDALDNNCNGTTDEQCDSDLDGYCNSTKTIVGTPPVCSKGTGDCDDTNNQVYPGKLEICDDADNNCNGTKDEGCDADGDKYCTTTKSVIGKPASCINGPGDCNDGNAAVNPGATEICDGIDNNCAGGTDEVCNDLDGDGYCNGVQGVSAACPKGGSDCDDTKAGVNPGAIETCATAYDDNCNGLNNEVNATACTQWYVDGDADGYGGGAGQCQCAQLGTFTAPTGGDCLDTDKTINPGATEICDNIDNDCANGKDDGCDADGDLYCNANKLVAKGALCSKSPIPTTVGVTVKGTDCDDTQASVNLGAAEICDNLDNNCNLAVDEGCDDDNDNFCEAGMTIVGTPATCTGGGGDCNDDIGSIKPGPVTTENCSTAADDNCDGSTDGLNAIGCVNFYFDNDGDGYGVTGNFQCRCAASGKYNATQGNDCDDNDPTSFSVLAAEVCDGKDNNCNGTTDEGCDKDKDGYCDSKVKVLSTAACPKTTITAGFGDDCDDGSKSIFPTANELCDAVDNNCAGGIDENCDKDGDKYCDANKTTVGTPPSCIKGGGDCADTNAAVNPGTTEVCNGVDDNCNVLIDEVGATGCVNYFYDGDQDKVGVGSAQCLCAPTGLYTAKTSGDCNDTCPTCTPGAIELCDGNDNNCDNVVDDGCNVDGDGYCTAAKVTVGTPPVCPKGGGDCNDGNGSVYPAAQELCNLQDDNCNGIVDENADAGCQSAPNANGKCVSGSCKIVACSTGFYDFNGSYSDGCECNGNDNNEPNDSCGAATVVDTALYDNGSKDVVEGRAVSAADNDWYAFYAVDLGDYGSGVCDTYNVRVVFTANPGGLAFDINRGGCPSGSNTVCCGQTDFNWFTDFKGASNGDPSRQYSEYGECPCNTNGSVYAQHSGWNIPPGYPGGGGPYCMNYNSGYVCIPTGFYYTNCQDESAWYYVRVYNTGAAPTTCGAYKLEISNGVYGQPGTGNGYH